jgi:putative tryptophan/tyrosine transport system substrate-binding protein
MRRREFITLLGGAAAWPLAARAQQSGRVRRVGMLLNGGENDRLRQAYLGAMREGLAKLGWVEGRNLQIDLRWNDDAAGFDRDATELVNLAPDVIVTSGGAATRAVQQQTHTIPIVFAVGGDAVANGLVHNIARPDGNVTGFSSPEPSVAGKWLELLKEAAPRVTRVAILFNPDLAATAPIYVSLIEAVAPALGVEVSTMPIHNAVEIVRAIDAFAAEAGGGLIVLPPAPAPNIREALLQLVAQHRVPAIYATRDVARAGGLLTYSADTIDHYRRAASYVDRLLRGGKIGELPIQFPIKYELMINLKAAKAIGLKIPESFLLRADEILE